MISERDIDGMSVLVKSGALIAVLESCDEVSARVLAARLGEPVSSTYRLLASLVQIGWVDPGTQRGSFRLGVEFARVGSLVEDRLNVRDASKPALVELRAVTSATVYLCFLRHDSAVCVERLDGRDVHPLVMRLGDSLPLYRGAAPIALLSFLPESERDAVLGRFAARRDAGEDVPDDYELRSELQRTRERGFSVSDEGLTAGIAAIGAPVFNHRGELEAAIAVSGLRDHVFSETLDVSGLVLRASSDASRSLGFVDGR